MKYLLVGVLSLILIGFTNVEQKAKKCEGVAVRINNQYENYFIDESDILKLITNNGSEVIEGVRFTEIDIRLIEERVKSEKFIKKAQIYKDHAGNLIVNAEQRRPMARITRENGPDAYIAEDGTILPVSGKYSARVVLITGSAAKSLAESGKIEEEDSFYELINYINNDKFWKAQIAQVDIDKSGNVNMYPQVTKQLIEFGAIEDIEVKFKKLMIFYKEILPRKGWNAYTRVNLKFKDQIICE